MKELKLLFTISILFGLISSCNFEEDPLPIEAEEEEEMTFTSSPPTGCDIGKYKVIVLVTYVFNTVASLLYNCYS